MDKGTRVATASTRFGHRSAAHQLACVETKGEKHEKAGKDGSAADHGCLFYLSFASEWDDGTVLNLTRSDISICTKSDRFYPTLCVVYALFSGEL